MNKEQQKTEPEGWDKDMSLEEVWCSQGPDIDVMLLSQT